VTGDATVPAAPEPLVVEAVFGVEAIAACLVAQARTLHGAVRRREVRTTAR
jgi:hypothetical protein